MPVTWTQDLATGIRSVDEQHRDLFANIAALRDSMRLGNSRGAIATMRFLERYVKDHFASEERWMEAAEYPDLAQHRAEHQMFASEFHRRAAEFNARGPTAALVIELSDWLGEWLRDHVLKVDAKMGQFLQGSQPRRTGAGDRA